MSRCIDADALIESIKNTADLGGWIGEALYQIKQVAVKYIDSAPSIDIEPKRGEWIPCSERLPSKDGRYLVTFPTLINKPWIDILWYGRPTFPETDHPCFYASDDEYGDVEYDDVVAWMPLPEPDGEREGE